MPTDSLNEVPTQGVKRDSNTPTFQYVLPTDEQKALMQVYRDLFDNLSKLINTGVPNSRGKSLALTKLEESAFWLNKGITNNS